MLKMHYKVKSGNISSAILYDYYRKKRYQQGACKLQTPYFSSIKKNYLSDPNYTYYYDEQAQVPYLLSNDKSTFISFDDPRSISAKCEYVIKNNCAGVMYWENGCDTTGDLIKAIYECLKQ